MFLCTNRRTENWELTSCLDLQKVKAFPLRGHPRVASLAPSGQFTFRWREAPDEVEKGCEFAGSSYKT